MAPSHRVAFPADPGTGPGAELCRPTKATRGRGRPAGNNASPAILGAAKRLFLESGFDAVNLERVGEAAGVTRQTVYNLFGSKEAVFKAMVELHWYEIARDSAAVLSTSLDPAHGPAAILRGFGEAIVRFIDGTEQIAFTRLVIMESRQRPWIAEEFYRLGKQPLLEGFVTCLKRLHEGGVIVCLLPEVAAHQFFGLIQEVAIWPHVMAIGPAATRLPSTTTAIEEAVLMFLARYGTIDPASGARGPRATLHAEKGVQRQTSRKRKR